MQHKIVYETIHVHISENDVTSFCESRSFIAEYLDKFESLKKSFRSTELKIIDVR